MRFGACVLAVLLALILAMRELLPELDVVAVGLAQNWWVLPLAASLISIVVLATATALGLARMGGKPASILTGAYLTSGPSMAALGLASFLPFSTQPPIWAGSLTLVLLFGSAWIYYRSLNDSDEEKSTSFRSESTNASIS